MVGQLGVQIDNWGKDCLALSHNFVHSRYLVRNFKEFGFCGFFNRLQLRRYERGPSWVDRVEALVYNRKAFSPKLSQVLRSGGCVPGAACLATNMQLTKPAFVCGRISSLYHGADHAGVVVLWQHSS